MKMTKRMKDFLGLVLCVLVVFTFAAFDFRSGALSDELNKFIPLDPDDLAKSKRKLDHVIRIAVVVDGGVLRDRAFNEATFRGAGGTEEFFFKDFEKFIEDENQNEKMLSQHNYDSDWSVEIKTFLSREKSEEYFIEKYKSALFWGADYVVAVGFFQDKSIRWAREHVSGKTRFIFVDGDVEGYKAQAGIVFSAEKSGYIAALASSLWLVANTDLSEQKELKFATYGGLAIPPVLKYMYGYYWGVRYLQRVINEWKSSDGREKGTTDRFFGRDGIINSFLPRSKFGSDEQTRESLKGVSLKNVEPYFPFTESFDLGKGRDISEEIINRGARVIFPVAGPQIDDTIWVIKKKKMLNRISLVGVDTDARQKYSGDDANLFITSAIKQVSNAVETMLWSGLSLSEKQEKKVKKIAKNIQISENYYIEKRAVELGSVGEHVGISYINGDNDAKDVWNFLMKQPKIAVESKKVHESWNRCLEEYWTKGNERRFWADYATQESCSPLWV